VAVIALASVGVSYASTGSVTPDCTTSQSLCIFKWVKCNDNGSLVAHTMASINGSKDTITFQLTNVYPNYNSTISFGILNQNCTPGMVSTITMNYPSYFGMTLDGITKNQIINAGQEADGVLDITFSNDAPNSTMGQTYNLCVTIVVTQAIQQTPNKTQTILGSLPNPSDYGQPVTFGAAVISSGLKAFLPARSSLWKGSPY
jgi:hypothetical protein